MPPWEGMLKMEQRCCCSHGPISSLLHSWPLPPSWLFVGCSERERALTQSLSCPWPPSGPRPAALIDLLSQHLGPSFLFASVHTLGISIRTAFQSGHLGQDVCKRARERELIVIKYIKCWSHCALICSMHWDGSHLTVIGRENRTLSPTNLVQPFLGLIISKSTDPNLMESALQCFKSILWIWA